MTGKDVREKNGILQGATLGTMLEDDEFHIPLDIKEACAAFFVRKSGDNFRNNLSHGRLMSSDCNQRTAYWTFQCLLWLLIIDPDGIPVFGPEDAYKQLRHTEIGYDLPD